MLITAEILFFKLSEKYVLKKEHSVKYKLPVSRIQIWDKGLCMEPDTLYLSDSEDFFASLSVQSTGSFLFCGPFRESAPEPDAEVTWAVLETPVSAARLQIELLEIYNQMEGWNSRMLESIISQENYLNVMAMGREMFRWEYSISTRYMKSVYQTPACKIPTNDNQISELVDSLIMQPEFHAAALWKKSFYFYDKYTDSQTLCGNIYSHDQYWGRIVMMIDTPEVADGARELFEIFTEQLELLISCNFTSRDIHIQDPLHHLFQDITAGKTPEQALWQETIKNKGWKDDDSYIVLKLQFYEESNWDTHLETTLPYLIQTLEQTNPESCAIVSGFAIFWLINRSLSPSISDFSSFKQQIASFVREHVCSAGISSLFTDLSLLSAAVSESEIALRIGKMKSPQFWYFFFDDYRLTYMFEKITEELPLSALQNPVITQLAQYDRTNHTELVKTLHAYLKNNLNMSKAADCLFIHRTTFCRRMNRIEQLTGVHLNNTDTVLDLLLSFRLAEEKSISAGTMELSAKGQK